MLRKAESFIKDALKDLKRKDYDLAMFHIKQACQLIIKAKLLELTGYFEKTHSLRRLLSDLSKVFIASRYLPEEFRKEDVEKALELYKNLKKLLWNS